MVIRLCAAKDSRKNTRKDCVLQHGTPKNALMILGKQEWPTPFGKPGKPPGDARGTLQKPGLPAEPFLRGNLIHHLCGEGNTRETQGEPQSNARVRRPSQAGSASKPNSLPLREPKQTPRETQWFSRFEASRIVCNRCSELQKGCAALKNAPMIDWSPSLESNGIP